MRVSGILRRTVKGMELVTRIPRQATLCAFAPVGESLEGTHVVNLSPETTARNVLPSVGA